MAKAKAAGNKKAFDAPTGTTFFLDPGPAQVRIIGFDTNDGIEHVLADPERLEADDALAEEDIINVMTLGVKKPILGRKDGEFIDVIDGRHRVRWMREANKRLVKAGQPPHRIEVKVWRPKNPDRADAELMMLMASLNEIVRKDDQLTQAKKAQRMLSRGLSEKEVAIAFGVSEAVVKNRLKLLDVDTKVLKAMEEKRIAPSVATELAAVPRAEQVPLMEKLISEGRATTGEAKREVTIAKESRASAAATPADTRRSKPGDTKSGATKSDAAKPETPKSDHAAKPKMVIINRLLALEEIGKIDLTAMTFIDCLKWMLGQKESSRIAGLNACLKLAEKPVKKLAK